MFELIIMNITILAGVFALAETATGLFGKDFLSTISAGGSFFAKKSLCNQSVKVRFFLS